MIDILLPPSCWANHPPHDIATGLSQSARQQIAQLSAHPYCLHCGLAIGPHESHDARDPCGRCGEREVGVVRIARVGPFSEPLITLVHRLKFARAWEIARILAPFLYQTMLRVSETTSVPVDVMVPIPLHWSRRMQRGFNQAEELAREVTKVSHWPMTPALQRIRRTHEQARIDAPTLRTENIRGAFACRPSASGGTLHKKHLWLIDDVSTTGATLHSAAPTLRKLPPESRPASINAAVICITDHREHQGEPAAFEDMWQPQ